VALEHVVERADGAAVPVADEDVPVAPTRLGQRLVDGGSDALRTQVELRG
jgi:hypothetical protein